MEVYSAVFNSNVKKIREVQAQIIDENSFSEITEKIVIVGDCQEKIKTVLTGNNFVFSENIVFPSANQMSSLSFEKYKKSDTVDVAYFEPFYLKDFFMSVSAK
jgi:tRNA threonylcarbamoyladenosine biosynthesis protein TsaB